MWEIKGKDNQVKATVGSLEYNGEWMGESYVTVTVESPAPVNFEIGDYIIYRDERFEINYDPGKIKSAPRYEKGDAFKYENIKFNSLADELTRCDFLDVVLEDNQLHFTGLPKFSFYGNVQDLANRMQANLDRTYGKGTWSVVVSPEFQSTKEVNISVDTIKVQGALSILVNELETYYTIKGRTITIGAAGIPAGHLFKYGKGNGLYEIEQNAEADQAIVTRLRAYGSTRNLPHRYYNSLSGVDGKKLIPDNMAVQYLMLPEFPYTTQDPYIDSPNVAKLGIREGTVFFDGSGELEEIYPSIEGMTAEQLKAAGVPCNSTGALDEIVSAEQMTDNGVGEINEGETQTTAKPPTFKVTLKDLGFDINDYKTTETATISFKTGMLGGRDFEIVGRKKIELGGKVIGYELELNRVYDDGIKLWFPYKDYNAKGVKQNPDNPDKFVILHIEMPEVYIKAASQRLKEAATEWLSKNDYSRSIYAPKVDENFMARQHDLAMVSGGKIKSLHDTLKEGMLLLFEDEDLNIDASIFIDRLTIKEEGAAPTYEVVLKEEKTVGRLDKMQNQIDSLAAGKGQGGGGYTAAQIRSMIEAYGGTRFLSKIKDDRSTGKISSDKGFEAGEFVSGVSGGIFGMDANTGDSFAEVARLYVRVKAFFEELTTVKASVLAGKQYITPGGGITCTEVEDTDTAYRCYFLSEQDGEKVETKIIAGDQAISEMFNAKTGTSNKVSNHRYWRLVTAVNNDAYTDDNGNHYGYIDLSKTDCEANSDIPQAGDEICQLGNRNDKTRQTAMVFSTVDTDAPSIKLFANIDSYTLTNRVIISFGRNPLTGQIFFRLGASDAKQFLSYNQNEGLVVAGAISSKSTIDNKKIHNYVEEAAKAEAEKAKKELEGNIKELQDQIDGVVEAWNGMGAPTLTNYPANQWTTEEERKRHERDIYTDITPYVDDATTPTSGQSWKWYYNSPTDYGWVKVADSDAIKALQLAQISVRDTDILFISHGSANDAPVLPVTDANGVITDAKGWVTDAPDSVAGRYIWQVTYVRHGDGQAEFKGLACIPGQKSVAQTSETVEYAVSAQGDTPPSSGWQTSFPSAQKGQFRWKRVTTAYSDGSSTVAYSAEYIPFDGQKGDTGASYSNNLLLNPDFRKGLFKWGSETSFRKIDNTHTLDGRSSVLLDVRNLTDPSWYGISQKLPSSPGDVFTASIWSYCENLSTIDSTAEIELWAYNGTTRLTKVAASIKPTKAGQWERAVVTHTMPAGTDAVNVYAWLRRNGKIWLSSPKLEVGTNPDPVWTPNAEGATISSESVKYAKNTTGDQPADAYFTADSIGGLGTITGGDYIWSKKEVTYTDGTVTKEYAVSRIGADGETSIAGLHVAYCSGITGSLPNPTAVTDFQKELFDGAKYIGICTNYKADDPDDHTEYDWARFVGEDAALVKVNADALVFQYENGFATLLSPQKITLSATVQGIADPTYQWSHRQAGQTGFTDITAAYGRQPTLEVNPNGECMGNAESSTVRCTVNGTVHDEVTIAKVSSGSNGASYSANLLTGTRDWGGATKKEGSVASVTTEEYAGLRVMTTGAYAWSTFYWTAEVEEGVEYTMSAWAYCTADNVAAALNPTNWNAPHTSEATVTGRSLTPALNRWSRIWFTFRCTRPGSCVVSFENKTGAAVKFAGWKLEEGVNRSPQWSPAAAEMTGADYTENLLLGSGTAVTNSLYPTQSYRFSAPPVEGKTYTCTLWGRKSPNPARGFAVFNSNGYVVLAGMKEVEDGVYRATFKWKVSHPTHPADNTHLHVYETPHDAGDCGPNTIDRIKLEEGDNPKPVWTPAPSDSDAYTVILTNESHIFEGDTEKAVAGHTDCGVIVYKGNRQVAATIDASAIKPPSGSMPAGMSVAVSGSGTTSAKFTVTVNTNLIQKQGTLNVPVTVDGRTFTKVFSWSLSLQGRGIASTVEKYAVNNSPTTAPADSAFSTSVPQTSATNRYLWNMEVTTYTDGTTKDTGKRVIGVHGANGEAGASVAKVENFYLASAQATGVTTSTAGWTTDASSQAATISEAKPYLWNYEKVTYSKGNPTQTEPHVTGRWSRDGKDARSIAVKSYGYYYTFTGGKGYVKVDGKDVFDPAPSKRGINMVTLNRQTLAKTGQFNYDLYTGNTNVAQARTNFINKINSLDDSVFVCLLFADNVTWTPEIVTAMKKLGSLGDIRTDGASRTFAFIGHKGLAPGYALQAQGENAHTPPVEVSAYVAEGMFTTSRTQAGIKEIKEEYYLSTSRETPTGDYWRTSAPVWQPDRYIWTRSHVYYTDGTDATYGEVCSTGASGFSYAANMLGGAGRQLGPNTAYQLGAYGYAEAPVPGKTYTLTVCYKVGAKDTSIAVFVDNKGYYKIKGLTARVETVEAFRFTCPTPSNSSSPKLDRLAFFHQPNDGDYDGTNTYVKWAVLVEGDNPARVWVPSAAEMATGVNELRNATFANSSDHWAMSAKSRVDINPGFAGAGVNSAVWEVSGDTSRQWRGISQGTFNAAGEPNTDITIPTSPGDVWTASVHTLCPDLAGIKDPGDKSVTPVIPPETIPLADRAKCEIQFYNASGAKIKTVRYSIMPTEQEKWQRHHLTVVAPDGAAYVGLYHWLLANGKLYMAKPMLSRGATLGDWTPSPLDTSYLQQALQTDASLAGGLVLATHIQLGYKTESGQYKVMSGLNGIYNSGAHGGGPAFWGGGKLQSAAEYPDDPDSAATMIFHDGTAYFSRNDIRLTDNAMEVGENVRLGRNGLEMNLSDGSTALQIANVSVGDNPSTGESESLSVSLKPTLALHRYKVTHNYHLFVPDGGTIDPSMKTDVTFEAHLDSSWHSGEQLFNKSLKSGDEVELTFNASVPRMFLYYGTTAKNVSWITKMYVFFGYNKADGSSVTLVNNTAFDIRLNDAKTAYTGTGKIRLTLPVTSEKYWCSATIASGKPSYNTASWKWEVEDALIVPQTLTFSASGRARRSIAERTILGNDGFITVWDKSALLVNGTRTLLKRGSSLIEQTDSSTTISYGTTAFEVGRSGIRYRVSGGEWKNLT